MPHDPFDPSPPRVRRPPDNLQESSGEQQQFKAMLPTIKGRGATHNPANRFEAVRLEIDIAEDPSDGDSSEGRDLSPLRGPKTELYEDQSESIVTENQSPDIGFRWSINPYRGCEHGCAYCYARPYHEYLGLSAGLDFERKIIVKRKAPELLKAWLRRPKWRGEHLALSGVTDPYQPIERSLRITRQILELLLQCRHSVTVITKNALILRDLDILSALAESNLTTVTLSITSLEPALARTLEPRTSAPEARFRAVRELADAGVPVQVNLSPIIPGLNDHEIPKLIEAAADAGATSVGMQMLRLPGAVEGIFLDWLDQYQPLAKEKILNRIRSIREGKLNETDFGTRMKGKGAIAESLFQTYRICIQKHRLKSSLPEVDESQFQPPPEQNGQLRWF